MRANDFIKALCDSARKHGGDVVAIDFEVRDGQILLTFHVRQ